MASGDKMFECAGDAFQPPGANSARLALIAGGSTPAENIRAAAFDGDSSEYADYGPFVLEGYGSSGLTLKLKTSAESASNAYRFEAALRRLADDAEQLSSAHTYQFNGVTITAPSATTEIGYDSITFTDGADMDSVADGEMFILRIYRDHDHAGDTMSGNDAYLHHIYCEET